MKFIFRVALVCVILFIIILLLLLRSDVDDNSINELDNDYVDVKLDDFENPVERTEYSSFDQRLKKFIAQYKLPWTNATNTTINVWERAAHWVSSRETYREVPSELGKFIFKRFPYSRLRFQPTAGTVCVIFVLMLR